MYQTAKPKTANFTDIDYRWSTIIFAVMVLTALILKAMLLPRWPIHQDEFHYLSMVYTYERGEPMLPFMTAHVHLFSWLSAVGQNEVAQVIAARIVMHFLLLGTCFYLFLLAHHFLCVRGALFCVLCYLSFLFTVTNGASFRHDTPSTFFFTLALYYFVVHEDSVFSNILAGAGMAISLLFTIKAAIYLPVFAGWFLSRLLLADGRIRKLLCTCSFLLALILGFITLYSLHAATLALSATGKNSNFLGRAFSTFITLDQIFPARNWTIQTLVIDFLIWFLLFGGLVIHLADLVRCKYNCNDPRAYLLVFFVPLFSLVVYRNAYPYFFVFLMPTATLFCGYGFERLASKIKNAKRFTVPVLSVALGLMVLTNFIVHFPSYVWSEAKLTALQSEILGTIHTIFPEPVPYVDKCSMVSSYPKMGLFISVASMCNYLRRGEPIMDDLLIQNKPRFLLANSFFLDLNSDEPPKSTAGQALLEADWAALKSYFIHHWGPVWVVGKEFNLGPEKRIENFEIIASGLYTVEAETEVHIDDIRYRRGDVVYLDEGAHIIAFLGAKATIRLRWGRHLYCPDNEPESTIYLGPFL